MFLDLSGLGTTDDITLCGPPMNRRYSSSAYGSSDVWRSEGAATFTLEPESSGSLVTKRWKLIEPGRGVLLFESKSASGIPAWMKGLLVPAYGHLRQHTGLPLRRIRRPGSINSTGDCSGSMSTSFRVRIIRARSPLQLAFRCGLVRRVTAPSSASWPLFKSTGTTVWGSGGVAHEIQRVRYSYRDNGTSPRTTRSAPTGILFR